MSPTAKILTWSSIIGLIVGGGLYVWLNVKRVMNFDWKISGFKLKGYDLQSVSFDLSLDIINPSDINADIKGMDLDILINGNSVAKVTDSKLIKINSNSTSTITIPVKASVSYFKDYASYSKVYNLLISAMNNADNINITTKGKFSGVAFGLALKDYPIDITYTLKEILS